MVRHHKLLHDHWIANDVLPLLPDAEEGFGIRFVQPIRLGATTISSSREIMTADLVECRRSTNEPAAQKIEASKINVEWHTITARRRSYD